MTPELRQDLVEATDGAIGALEGWTRLRNWEGYDPYDIRERLLRLPSRCHIHSLVSRLCRWECVRRTLGIRPRPNTKGLGLFVQAYARLASQTGEDMFLRCAMECADKLENLASVPLFPHGWGHSFDWQSRIFFPKGTPFSPNDVEAARGFLALYKATGDERWFERTRAVCHHFLGNYFVDESVGDDAVCFSYSPIVRFHVHNTNLMIGSVLAQVGAELGNTHFQATARKCANFAMQEMGDDGSLNYWAKDQTTVPQQDSYHAGFEIRALLIIADRAEYAPANAAALRRYRFYCQHFIGPEGEAWRDPDSDRLVDIHGCAEALLLHSALRRYDPEAERRMCRSLRWTLSHMRNTDGSFAYRRYRRAIVYETDRTPFMRWGQAWMLLALADARDVLRPGERTEKECCGGE